MKENLLACPFCGKQAFYKKFEEEIETSYSCISPPIYEYHYIGCLTKNCPGKMQDLGLKATQTIKKWNKRKI